MDARERLQQVQSALSDSGVRDVKFCFAQTKGVPMSHVQKDVADALEAFRTKKYHPLPKSKNSQKK